MSHGARLFDFLKSHREGMIASLRELVEHESPSLDKPALDSLAQKIASRFSALGGQVELVTNELGGDHVRARFEGGAGSPTLVLGHFDTVWPAGILATMPFRLEGNVAWGPGIYDMKAGLVILEFALLAIKSIGLAPSRPIIALWTSDEEIGSPTSRLLIEETAKSAAFALVLEPPLAGGRLKTARKGVGQFNLEVEGRAAHAGIEPEKGINAIIELAHQILVVQGLNRPEVGTTLNIGLVQGGTTPNVVPDRASAVIDVRVSGSEEAARIETALTQLVPVLPGARLKATGGLHRPPMVRTDKTAALLEQARVIGRELGIELTEGSTGGGSDGNFTAAVGTPTLDGLGADGRGAHASDEQIKIDSLIERAALLASLLLSLETNDKIHA